VLRFPRDILSAGEAFPLPANTGALKVIVEA
jgi:hypothetical protein